MEDINMIILCAMGASSSIIVKSIQENAGARGIPVEVACYPSMTYKEVDYKDVDIILLAPQVKGQKAEIEKYVESYKIPVHQIGMREYGLVKGGEILDQVMKVLKTKN